MMPISDYHIHTPLCGHANGQPAEYVKRALALGLKEIGFSDHAPLLSHRDPDITMDLDDLPLYHKVIEKLQRQYQGKILVRIGIEADFLPPYTNELRKLLAEFPYDYVIGSVHFLEGWAFDDPQQLNGWQDADINEIYHKYYHALRQSAESGLFDIIAHVDLVKKFGHRPSREMTQEITQTAQVFKKTGVVIEINTSGLRKPVGEIYPNLNALEIYNQFGVPITFGSDAHDPNEVGRDFTQAVELAKSAGYDTYAIFSRRKIERFEQLN
jgi:histidinol-phosphatase (PHP family)